MADYAVCPGRNVALLTTSYAGSQMVAQFDLDVDPTTRAKLSGTMPTTFDHTGIRLGFWRKS